MSQRGQPPGAGRRRTAAGWRDGRLPLAACLLILAAVALRGEVAAPALTGPLRRDGLPVGIVLEAVLACLLAALIVRHSRAPRGALIAARLRMLLFYVVGAGLIAIPAAYLLNTASQLHLRPRPAPSPTPSSSQRPRGLLPPGGSGSASGLIVIIILLALAAAVVIYLVARFMARHNWSRGSWRGRGAPSAAFEPSADAEAAELREAVEVGQNALRLTDDARAAIIACYFAMEQSLAGAGTPRAAADTPYEVLVRATDQGLIRTAAAGRLTVLFYEARFSSHPMPAQRRDDARQALAELAASLADPEPAPGSSR